MEANTALVAARMAQPSRSRPSQPLSRKELAELVNRHIWDHHRQQTPVDVARRVDGHEVDEPPGGENVPGLRREHGHDGT